MRERVPGALAVVPGRECLQDEQPVSHREDFRRAQVTGCAQRGQALGLGPEPTRGCAGQSLSCHASAVGVGDQPGICHVPAGQPPDRGHPCL